MQEEVCIEKMTGGIRLSSKSNNTWVSKVILCLAVMEKEYPTAMRELLHWARFLQKIHPLAFRY